jgi:hypothetical protein
MTDTDDPAGAADNPPPADPPDNPDTHLSRLQLLADVLVFQLKLLVDGLLDLLLSPASIVAAIAGLIAGGDRPDRYFRKVQRFGWRTERWLNLFGEQDRRGTADELVDPLRTRVIDGAQADSWISRTGTRLNRQLDGVNSALKPDESIRREPD